MLKRDDKSFLGRWWWSIDRGIFFFILLLFVLGIFVSLSATPAVANHLKINYLHFARQHFLLIFLGLLSIIICSSTPKPYLKPLAFWGWVFFLILSLLAIFSGDSIKGAKRWIRIGGFSLQPSEFLKPCLAILGADFLTRKSDDYKFYKLTGVFGLSLLVLMRQPDFGMSVIILGFLFILLFLNGLSLRNIAIFAATTLGTFILAYLNLNHVRLRINSFFFNKGSDNYQIQKSLNAFANGGLFGVGPGEGTVKRFLPDAHADFVFAVIGEEYGIISCIFVLVIFFIIIQRGINKAKKQVDPFIFLAAATIIVGFALQVVIHIAANLKMIPTKGIPLPLLSYGRSAMLSTCLSLGWFLNLTRKEKNEDCK